MSLSTTEAGRKCQMVHGTDYLENRLIGVYCHKCERYTAVNTEYEQMSESLKEWW